MQKKLYFPAILLSSLLIKILFFPTTVAISIAICALASLFGFLFYLETSKEEPVNEEIKERVVSLEKELKSINSFLQSTKLLNRTVLK